MSTAELGLHFGLRTRVIFLENRGSSRQNGHREKGDQRRPVKMNGGSKAKRRLETLARRVTRRPANGK